MKFSLGMKIVSLLSCVALVSMGFASWWIVKLPDEVTKNGSFTVYSVENKEIQFSATTGVTAPTIDGEIKFGKPNSTYGDSESVSSKWLIANGSMEKDALVATLTFPVTIKDDETTKLNALIESINVTFAPGSTIKSILDSAISAPNNYLAAPVLTWSYTDGTTTVTSTNEQKLVYSTSGENVLSIPAPEASAVTVTVTITFDWGTKTGGANPFCYYNEKDYDDFNEEAYNLLLAVAGLAKPASPAEGTNYGYDLTLSATVKS